MSDYRVYLFAADPTSSNPITGLALTDFQVDVHRVNKSTQAQSQVVTNAPLLKEIGEGFYLYILSNIDDLTFDYFSTVKYTGATPLDTTLWAGTDESSGVSRFASLLSFDIVASIVEVPSTGLALTDFEVDVFRITKRDNQVDQIVVAADMTLEVGDGHYAYYLASQDFVTYDYLVLVQYEGAALLDGTVWTGKPAGDIPSSDTCSPSDRRTLPRTLLPLDRWAEIIGIDRRHFRQVTVDSLRANQTCDKVWKQYAWQEAGQMGRYDVADAIQQAERTFAQYLGYKLLPTWEVEERKQTSKPGNVELFNAIARDVRGFRLSIQADWGYFLEGGIEAKAVIEANAAVSYSDLDGDGYDETATVQVTTTVTDVEEIAIYYPCEEAADEWEIRPLRSVSISGGVATIKMWRHQLVDPDLVEAIVPEAVDGNTDSNFLTTVDVYRHYNDPSQHVNLLWDPVLGCQCSAASTCCPICGQTTQAGCLTPKDYTRGLLMYRPATYDADDEEWDSEELTCNRNPDQLEMWYRAGFQSKSRTKPTLEMDPQWERVVAFYALALLDREICDCAPIKGIAAHWREDLARTTAAGSSMQISDTVLDNPLGTTRAAQLAWNTLKEQGRRLAKPAHW